MRIYGEELDVVSDNKKYGTEIFSNTLNNIFKSLSDIKERSTFYTQSKRNNIYENSIKGVSGYFLKNDYEEEKTRTFLTYFEHIIWIISVNEPLWPTVNVCSQKGQSKPSFAIPSAIIISISSTSLIFLK